LESDTPKDERWLRQTCGLRKELQWLKDEWLGLKTSFHRPQIWRWLADTCSHRFTATLSHNVRVHSLRNRRNREKLIKRRCQKMLGVSLAPSALYFHSQFHSSTHPLRGFTCTSIQPSYPVDNTPTHYRTLPVTSCTHSQQDLPPERKFRISRFVSFRPCVAFILLACELLM